MSGLVIGLQVTIFSNKLLPTTSSATYCGQHPLVPYSINSQVLLSKLSFMLRMELKGNAEMPAESEASVSCLPCGTYLANSVLESTLKYYCKEKKDH